jgi:SAM-dependent methyltransferase
MSYEEDRRSHWEQVYTAKTPAEVSWFQDRPDVSLELICQTDAAKASKIIDIGGGASTLVDHLLDEGFSAIAVLDLSAAALAAARQRLGEAANKVRWIAADVTQWTPGDSFHLWHDRAVLHFLTRVEEQQAYGRTVRAAVKPGGWAMIAGFAPGGPTKCSGLETVQHDADSLQRLVGSDFGLVTTRDEIHRTPWNSGQAFRYHLFLRN